MKPFRKPADPARLVKDYLAATLPGLVASPSPSFGMVVPSNWNKDAPAHVSVFDDGGPHRWPVSTRPTVRVTVWANGRDRSREIAGIALGVLMAHRIEGVSTITNPTALVEGRDSNNGGLMCSFTVSAQARTLAG